nr:hypothetical protein [Tanacetum cinerariifolium]
KREATAVKIALLLKSKRNCQSKSDDSYAKDSYEVPVSAASTATTDTASDGTGKKKGRTVTLTAKDMPKRKNDVKARTTLLFSLPDEHQLRFSKYKTAQELWDAILKTFGGNEVTKKTKKNLLKQQYGNFKAEGSETLEQTFNRLQMMVGQLQSDLDTMSLDEDVNTATVSTASTIVPTASANIGVASISQDTTCAYIASQSSGSQIKFKDINQIDKDDMEEMDIKWNMALLSIRADKFWKKTWKKISIQGTDVAGFDKSKVECFNCHKMGHFARECRAPRSQDKGRRDNYRQGSKVEEHDPKALMAIDGVGWDWSYMANDEENHALVAEKEAPTEFALMANTSAESKVFDNSLCSKDCKKNTNSLNSKITDLTDKLFDAKNMIYHYKLGLAQVKSGLAEHKDREIKYCEKIKGLEFKTESSDEYIEILKKEVDLLKKEKEGLDGKLAGFQTAFKDLDSLLESQRLDKNKEGLGYSVVLPPPTQIYSSPKKDMSWTRLPEFKDDTVTDYSRPVPMVESSPDDAQNRNPFVTEEASPSTILPKSFIKFVKANDSPTKSKIDKAKKAKKSHVKYAEQYREPPKKPNKKGKNETSKSQNTTHKSFTPRPVVHKPYRPTMRPVREVSRAILMTKAIGTVAALDKCMIWHRRLGHLNFKTMNELVRHNLVRGLPIKCFENDHTCTACLKGKQHKASCKSKLVNSLSKPLHTLHMDLFGPTSDETSGILRKFITKIENLKDLKVKIIRCDNRGEFRNKEMNNFCSQKGIKREFSNARTPQQNDVAERRNRTLIEAARTMLADAKLPVTFWAEVVNTACYVQNRALVNKSQNKSPYELFNGRTPAIGFLKPFGCHVMILNTLDNLGKFEAKEDEGYFIGYSMSSKAFRVFNKRTKRVEENLHVEFLENKAIEKGAGPNWLFDIDSLTESMNYVPVDAGTNSTNLSATKDAANQEPQDDCSTDVPERSGNSNPTATSINPLADQLETLIVETPIPIVSSPVLTACFTDSLEPSSDTRVISKRVANQVKTPSLENILTLENRFEDILGVTTNSDEYHRVEADVSNMETITASPTPTLRIHKDHPKSQIIGPVDTPIQTMNKAKEVGEQSFIATIHQKTDPALLQFCLFSCFLSQVEPKKISNALQDPSWKEDGIFLSQDKYIGDILKKFGYSDVRSSNTPMENENPWGKDETGKDVDLYLYRSMIRSLMYLTASIPDIMFDTIMATSTTEAEYVAAVSCCGQVLWIQNQLLDYGLSMPCEALSREISSSILRFNKIMARLQFCDYHNMVAILEKSEHNVDFHPIVDFVEASPLMIETTEEGTKILTTIDGILRTVTESSLRRNLKLQDEEGISSLLDAELFENLTLMGTIFLQTKSLLFKRGEGSSTPTEPHHTPFIEAQQTSSTTPLSPTLPSVTTALIPTVTPSDTHTLRQYTKRARIAQSSALPPVAYEPASPLRDVSQGEACPTDSDFGADQDRATIAKTSTLPYDSAPRVTFPATPEGSMHQILNELTDLCTILQRQHSELISKFETQELEINRLKARVKLLEDKEGVAAERSGDDAPIKGRNLDEGEAACKTHMKNTINLKFLQV